MFYFYIYVYNIIYLQNVVIFLILCNVIDFYLMEDVYCKIYLYILVLIFKVDDVVVIVFGLFFFEMFLVQVYIYC